MLAHLRSEAYPVYGSHRYPPERTPAERVGFERNNELIDASKLGLEG